MGQLALPLGWDREPEGFLVTPSNARAVAVLDAWRDWPAPAGVLAGPPRSGRSRLARRFAALSGGTVVDDAEEAPEVELFHAWNRAAAGAGAPLLLVARALPPGWAPSLPDLRSRLAASAAAEIGPPDDPLMRALLERGFRERGVDARPDLLDWLADRLERSHAAAERAVALLDRAVMERRRRLSIPLARATLADAGLVMRPGEPDRP